MTPPKAQRAKAQVGWAERHRHQLPLEFCGGRLELIKHKDVMNTGRMKMHAWCLDVVQPLMMIHARELAPSLDQMDVCDQPL